MRIKFFLGKFRYKKALGDQNIEGQTVLKRVLKYECENLSLFLYINIGNGMYINQQDAQNSCDYTLFSIRCSTCFGLY